MAEQATQIPFQTPQVADLQEALRTLWPDRKVVYFTEASALAAEKGPGSQLTEDEIGQLSRVAAVIADARRPRPQVMHPNFDQLAVNAIFKGLAHHDWCSTLKGPDRPCNCGVQAVKGAVKAMLRDVQESYEAGYEGLREGAAKDTTMVADIRAVIDAWLASSVDDDRETLNKIYAVLCGGQG